MLGILKACTILSSYCVWPAILTPSLQNPLYIISSPTVRLLIRAVGMLEDTLVWEEPPGETTEVELQNFKNVLRAELQHRGEPEVVDRSY